MSEPESAPAPDALQFEQAEFVAPAARACGFCKAVITDQYFAANDKQLCTACHDQLRAAFAARSGASRFFAALGWGGGGALLGAALYYGIRVATGYEIGLVAIVVGVLVGKGVARGTRGYGGRGYAFMAVMLTYFSIVLTYVPTIYAAVHGTANVQMGPIAHFIAVMLTIGLTLIAPFVVGFHSPLSLFISGIALYQAWKITRGSTITITGPHAIGR